MDNLNHVCDQLSDSLLAAGKPKFALQFYFAPSIGFVERLVREDLATVEAAVARHCPNDGAVREIIRAAKGLRRERKLTS